MSHALTRRTLLAAALATPLVSAGLGAAAQTRRPAAEGWEPRAPMPWVAQEIYCAVVGQRVVVAVGLFARERGVGVLDRTAIYDARRDAWSEGPRLPRPTHHPVLAAARGRVFAFGGYAEANGGQWSAQTEVLALDGDRWVEAGRLPEPQSESVALAHGGRVHLISGRTPKGAANAQWNDQGDTDAHRVFDPRTARWTDARPAPGVRNSAAGAEIGGKLYLVGGRTVGGGNMARLDRYDPATDRWRALRPMPQGSGGLAAAALGGRLYAFGGEWFAPGGGGVYAEVWEYDPRTDRWRAAAPMRTPRHGLAACAVGGRVLAIGGAARVSARDTTGVLEAYRPG